MSALDQSLDEILSSKPKKVQQKKKPVVASSKVGKAVQKPKAQQQKQKQQQQQKPSQILDASFATKVIVYGLPKDIKQDAIKDFFASQVGGVSSVALTYNEKGQSKGIATILFKSSGNASKAVEKFNGAPIDGGSSKLKLELIVDPTRKPLAARIVANTKAKETPKKANQKTTQKAADKPKPKEKKPKHKKKTVEELDQEMTDYFEKKD